MKTNRLNTIILAVLFGMICTLISGCNESSENLADLKEKTQSNVFDDFDTNKDDQSALLDEKMDDKYEELMNIIENATLQYPSSNDDFEYNVYDSYVEITKYTGIVKGKDIVFPSEIDGLPVLVIGAGEAVYDRNDLTVSGLNKPIQKPKSLTIGYGVAIIGNSAFKSAIIPPNSIIPDSVLEIDDSSFNGAAIPDDFILPSSLRKIKSYSFYNIECYDHKKYNNTNTIVKTTLNIEIPKTVSVIERGGFGQINSEFNIKIMNDSTIIDNSGTDFTNVPISTYYDKYKLCIYGYTSSTAAKYAAENSIPFKLIEE